MKYRNSTLETKRNREAEISRTDHTTTLVYVDKNAPDSPEWWRTGERRSAAQKRMLREAAEEVMSGKEDNYFVIIDDSTAYGPGEACAIVEKATRKIGKNVIRCTKEDSETSAHRDLLQTNDFAIGRQAERPERE